MHNKKNLPTNNVKILHIVHDSMFIDIAYDVFEKVLPKGSEYLCILGKKEIGRITKVPAKKISWGAIFTSSFRRYLRQFSAIIFHSLNPYYYPVALLAPLSTKILWIGWGFDYYSLICQEQDLLKPYTLELFLNSLSSKRSFSPLKLLKKGLHSILTGTLQDKCLNRIDFFAPVISEEHSLVVSKQPRFQADFISWNYVPISSSINYLSIDGNNILIGNSATYANNHVEAMQLLSNFDLRGRKIICPLTYGDSYYRAQIVQTGEHCFGKSFQPIINSMPFDEYIQLLSTCSLVFMNHLRQQGVGNIEISLMLGAKVFLDPLNPLSQHYQNIGVKVFNVNISSQDSLCGLPEEMAAKNRFLISQKWNKDSVLEKTRSLLTQLL